MNTSAAPRRPTGQMPVSPAAPQGISPAGRDINITWWYTFISIAGMSIFLLAIAAVASTARMNALGAPSWQVALLLACFIATAVSSVYASWLLREGYGAGWPPRNVTIMLLAPPALSWLVTVFIPGATLYGATPLWIQCSIILTLVQRRQRWQLLAAGLALIIIHGLLNPGTPEFLDEGFLLGIVLYVFLTPSTFLVSGWLWHLIVRLDQARTISGQLAVARERLRFASDLHDIQGHHLQVIALKAELADRLLHSDNTGHHTRAQQAIAEVRELAEQAQSETRQLVRDLRVVSLRDELENAQGVLEAAGVITQATVEPTVHTTASDETNRLLGLAVREATTNILRHADATTVSIRMDLGTEIELAIHNDGAAASLQPTEHTEGTGLAGLRSRFEAAGGSILTTQHDNDFHFQAVLPLSTAQEPA